MRDPPFDLMIISDGRPQLYERLARALAASAASRIAVQLRERTPLTVELFELARRLRELTRARGALLLLNDRVDVALAVEADGVQLPERGLPLPVARRLVGPNLWLGASRHDADGLAAAAREGADFATLSPVHAVEGKAPPLGIAGFAALAAPAPLPVYALGGVRVDDVAALRAASARGIAVIREVLQADDPALSAERLLSALARAPL